MKVGVIGVGVVGSATADAFEKSGIKVSRYDIVKFNSEDHWSNVIDSDIVFVCVPTLTVDDKQDQYPIQDVSRRLCESRYTGIVCIKCTVLPGTCRRLSSEFNLNIVHNPEFLTAAKPFEDFMSQKSVIISGHKDHTHVVEVLYKHLLPEVPVISNENYEVTEVAKYMRNCYLAIKVTYANEIFELCKSVGISYNDVKDMMLSQGKIEHGHWNVPGPDGKIGYGLGCLPKDTRALASFLREKELRGDILNASIIGNTFRRSFDNRCREIENGETKELLI